MASMLLANWDSSSPEPCSPGLRPSRDRAQRSKAAGPAELLRSVAPTSPPVITHLTNSSYRIRPSRSASAAQSIESMSAESNSPGAMPSNTQLSSLRLMRPSPLRSKRLKMSTALSASAAAAAWPATGCCSSDEGMRSPRSRRASCSCSGPRLFCPATSSASKSRDKASTRGPLALGAASGRALGPPPAQLAGARAGIPPRPAPAAAGTPRAGVPAKLRRPGERELDEVLPPLAFAFARGAALDAAGAAAAETERPLGEAARRPPRAAGDLPPRPGASFASGGLTSSIRPSYSSWVRSV
mmetsp:Transcript_92614/g.293722  ORF Transcript_92614/g.293722 Transcript_92614/m.293722 type:complete len:299 (-) Transcript_92614:594-1490(-)